MVKLLESIIRDGSIDEFNQAIIIQTSLQAKISQLEKRTEHSSIKELVAKNTFDFCNADITDENFPSDDIEPSIEGAVLENYDRTITSQEVIDDLKSKNRRPATASELLAWALKYPEEQRTKWIVALGQIWIDSADTLQLVVCLNGNSTDRRACLSFYMAKWDVVYCFLSFPQE